MAIQVLTLAGAAQFGAFAGTGLFSLADFNGIPRTTRLVGRFTYTEIPVAPFPLPVTTNIWFFAQRVVAPPVVFLLGRGQFQHGLIDQVDGNGYLKLCFDAIPREPADAPPGGGRGDFWNLFAFSEGKQNDGTVTLDLDTCPSPDTSREDSQ